MQGNRLLHVKWTADDSGGLHELKNLMGGGRLKCLSEEGKCHLQWAN